MSTPDSRVVIGFYDKKERALAYLLSVGADGKFQPLEYLPDLARVEKVVIAGRVLLDETEIDRDDYVGAGETFEFDSDEVPDICIVINVTITGKEADVRVQLFAQGGDGKLHLRLFDDPQETRSAAKRMAALAIMALRSPDATAPKAQKPIIRQFTVIRGGRDE